MEDKYVLVSSFLRNIYVVLCQNIGSRATSSSSSWCSFEWWCSHVSTWQKEKNKKGGKNRNCMRISKLDAKRKEKERKEQRKTNGKLYIWSESENDNFPNDFQSVSSHFNDDFRPISNSPSSNFSQDLLVDKTIKMTHNHARRLGLCNRRNVSNTWQHCQLKHLLLLFWPSTQCLLFDITLPNHLKRHSTSDRLFAVLDILSTPLDARQYPPTKRGTSQYHLILRRSLHYTYIFNDGSQFITRQSGTNDLHLPSKPTTVKCKSPPILIVYIICVRFVMKTNV